MMEVVTLKVSEVREWENNARIHTRRNLDALKKSLTAFGQTKPILVQKSTMGIIAGNGTYQAICALGWETVDCRILDISDEQAEALAIADNRTGLLSEWDDKTLAESLKKISEVGNLDLVGFSDLELEKMLSYQSGDLFKRLEENRDQEKKATSDDFEKLEVVPESEEEKKQEKSQSQDETPSYEEQLSFTLHGFIFNLSDAEEIHELKCLIDLLKDSDTKDRKEANAAVFESIKEILTDKFLR